MCIYLSWGFFFRNVFSTFISNCLRNTEGSARLVWVIFSLKFSQHIIFGVHLTFALTVFQRPMEYPWVPSSDPCANSRPPFPSSYMVWDISLRCHLRRKHRFLEKRMSRMATLTGGTQRRRRQSPPSLNALRPPETIPARCEPEKYNNKIAAAIKGVYILNTG